MHVCSHPLQKSVPIEYGEWYPYLVGMVITCTNNYERNSLVWSFRHGERVEFTDAPCLVGMIVHVAENNEITKLSILKFTCC